MVAQATARRGQYRAPHETEIARLQKIAGQLAMPSGYDEPLAAYCDEYRRTDQLPRTDYAKLTAKPSDTFRMFPAKCRRALGHASPDAKLVFWALWDQYEDKAARANGILIAGTDWLSQKTGVFNRNRISSAVLELEVRGLVRVKRGRGGNGVSYVNNFLLTAFPDCLGNAATADYERLGLPQSKSVANDPDTVALEESEIAARFNARIEAQVAIVRYTRNVRHKRDFDN